MPARRYELLICALLSVLLLCACGAQRGTDGNGTTPGAGLSLPAIAQLEQQPAVPRGSSYTQQDLFRPGSQYEAGLPNANVGAEDGTAWFSPAFSDQSPQLSNLAYAVYRIEAEAYDLSTELRLIWGEAPAPQQCWLALADWQQQRWSFMEADENWRISLGSLEPYMKDGSLLYAAVIVGGTEPVVLRELRLGPLPPQAIFTASPRSGDAPLTVSFDAQASLDVEGSITRYEWDFENDGSFELDSGLNPQAEHVYGAGQYQATLRVTSSSGLVATALSEAILVGDGGWQHSYGRALHDEFRDMLISSDGSLYLCGSSREPLDSQRFLGTLLKLDQQGNLIWARGYNGGASIVLDRMVEDESGNIVCSGVHRYAPDPSDAMLMRWSPAGEVLQSFVIEREYSLFLTDVFSLPGQILASGYCLNPGNNYNFFALLLEDDLELLWSSEEGGPLGEIATGAELIRDGQGSVEGLAAYGYDNDNGSSQPVLLKLDLSGERLDYLLLDTGREAGESAYSRRIEYIGTAAGEARYCLAGSFTGGNDAGAFMLNMGLEGASSAGNRFNQPARPFWVRAGASDLFVSGVCGVEFEDAWFAVLSLPELFLKESYAFSAGEEAVFNAAAEVEGGRLLCGSAESVPMLQETMQGMEGLPISASWLPGGDTGSISSDVSMLTLPLDGFDIAEELSIDEPAGENEMVVCFLAVPDLP